MWFVDVFMAYLRSEFDWQLQVRGWIRTMNLNNEFGDTYFWQLIFFLIHHLGVVSQICISDVPWELLQTTRCRLFSRLWYRHESSQKLLRHSRYILSGRFFKGSHKKLESFSFRNVLFLDKCVPLSSIRFECAYYSMSCVLKKIYVRHMDDRKYL